MGRKAKEPQIRGVSGRLKVIYPDARLEPHVCRRTQMRRLYCPCSPCRTLRRRKHRACCTCRLCYTDRMGEFIDDLGRRTAVGRWLWFVTLTFRTPHFPWMRGFPIEQPQPSPDFVHHFFAYMTKWIESQVQSRVEYFVADQFGEIGGRIHLHCGLSGPGLSEYRWKPLQEMLSKKAGYNRILPWEMDAGYYIGRYIGRDAEKCNWDWNVGTKTLPDSRDAPLVGRVVIAPSPDLSSQNYHNNLRRWHR
jgi:hypothetical protein